jgi:hypothetical protein
MKGRNNKGEGGEGRGGKGREGRGGEGGREGTLNGGRGERERSRGYSPQIWNSVHAPVAV